MTLTIDPIAPAQPSLYSSSAYPGLLSDLEQARIVERIVGLADEQIGLALRPAEVARYGVRTTRIGSAFGLALRQVDLPMLNRVVGLGLGPEREQLDRAIDEIYSLYGGAPVTFLVQVSPAALTPELDRLLESRGLQRMDNWACLIRGVETPPEISTSLRIERIGPKYAEAAARIACAGFELPAEYGLFLQRLVGRPGWQHYLAFEGEEPVATGALYVEGGIGYLTFGATLASHRGRGAQGAIIVRRIREAAALGCRWLVSETAEDLPERPFPSYRNMLRAGFRLAYLRPNYVHLPG